MDLFSQIRVFVEICDQGSLVAVAKARSIAPSAVTASLQKLETHLGTRLVHRTTRSLSITPEGERFLARARTILSDLDDAVEELADDGPLSGRIRMTALNDFGRNRLSQVIDDFQALHPAVSFELSLSDEVVDMVEGGFDLAIRTGPLTDSELKARLILRSTRSVCAAPEYWARHPRPVSPEDLRGHNCLVLNRAGDPQRRWHFRDGAKAITVPVSGNRSANDGGLLRQWALAGHGVILKTRHDMEEDIAAGRLSPVLEDYELAEINVYAVHPAGREASRRLSAFVDFLAAAFARGPIS